MPSSVPAGVFPRYCHAITSLAAALLLLASSVFGRELAPPAGLISTRHLLRAVCDEGKVAVGLTCVFCPSGKVKYPAGKNSIGVCQNAAIHCDEGQRGNNGVCANCPDGMVPNPARNNCVHCPPGQAKKPAGQSPNGECVAADQVCHKGQRVDEGVCANCPAGQVPTEDRTGCEYCSAGQVKHPPGTHKNGVCRCASKICDVGQFGDNGVCTNCGDNSVPNLGRTACEACPTGTIKDPPGTNANGVCVDDNPTAVVCGLGQWNNNGICTNCPAGKVPNTAGTGCEYCQNGQVKYPAGENSDGQCVSASNRCTVFQIGVLGVCSSCPGNQVPDAARASCDDCDAGSVKDPDATSIDAVCVDASIKCGLGQIASSGACANCPAGKVPNVLRTACEFCLAGQVKDPAGENNDGQCVSASTKCRLFQIGYQGECSSCTDNQVPDAVRANCVNCPAGKVKDPDATSIDAVCVDASIKCDVGQIASSGACADCPSGKVPDALRNACEFCAAGKVKYPFGSNSNGVCEFAECGCPASEVGQNGVCSACAGDSLPNEERTGCNLCAGFIQNSVCKPMECKGL